MDKNYDDLFKQNLNLQGQVESLKSEVELLRKSFLPDESYYKDRFYRINENVNDVVYRFQFKDRKYEYISPQVTELFGYTPEEFYIRPQLIRHIIHPDCMPDYVRHWRNIFKGKVPEYFELKIIRKNGEVRWILQKNLAIYNENNEIESIEGIVTDITERKKTENALIESEAQIKAILNNLPHLAWMKNTEGVYLSVNETFAKLYDKTIEEIVGRNDFDLYGQEFGQKCRDEDLHVILNKKQLFIREQNGETYWETIKAPIFNQVGEVIGITGVALDITEHKRNEKEIKEYSEKLAIQNVKLKLINDELKKAKEKAEKADRLKTAFLANMSHEIRTPMNAILGFATLLRDRKLSENKQVEFVNLINVNSRQLLHIISDIIDISKIESDQITIFNKSFNINKVFRTLKLNFENNIKAIKKAVNLEVITSLPDDDALIYTDKVKLEQIMSNLLSNAVKFTERGKIECGYTIENNEIVFFVSDTGIGITAEEQAVIFDRFRQVSSSYNKLYGGTGLGLSISLGLAQKLGGSISVRSEIDKGSVFYLRLPYKTGITQKPEKISYKTKYSWAGKTILIAEDEIANYILLESIVQPTKANVLWVKNGREAVEACRTNFSIDLVLMDIKMPEMNGLEATKIIKKQRRDLPIIAQTAFTMPMDEDNCLRAGCDDYLSKPLQVEEILDKIGQHLLKVVDVDKKKASKKIISE
jgi:PAS domain S-box-containing protein